MKTINKFIAGFAVMAFPVFCSCSEEKELTPGAAYPDFFAVDPADNSPEAQLRRDFRERTGIHLLFNDVLATYTDVDGIEKTEKVDFSWNMDSYSSKYYRFTYLDDIDEMRTMASAVEKYFIPYINIEGGQMKPYSILLPRTLEIDTYNENRWKKTNYISCWRCFAVNCDYWLGKEEEEMKAQGRSLLRTLVDEKISTYASELDDFRAVCDEVYDIPVMDVYPDWVDEQDISLIYELGFLSYEEDWYGEVEYDYLPYESKDIRMFKDAVFYEDEAEFREKWADYPKIIQKYELMKEAIEGLGINLNAVK